MPQTLNITQPEERERIVAAYTQAGLFAEDVLPQLYAAQEEIRSLIAKVEAAMPINGRGLRAANAQDQERFDAAFVEASGFIAGILDFAENEIEPITAGLLALKEHPVTKDVLPLLVVGEGTAGTPGTAGTQDSPEATPGQAGDGKDGGAV